VWRVSNSHLDTLKNPLGSNLNCEPVLSGIRFNLNVCLPLSTTSQGGGGRVEGKPREFESGEKIRIPFNPSFALLRNVSEFNDLVFVVMREIVHMQAGQCGNQIGAKVVKDRLSLLFHSNILTKDHWIIGMPIRDRLTFYRFLIAL
jgi:hypothetical protein